MLYYTFDEIPCAASNSIMQSSDFSQYAWNFINFNPIHTSNFLKASWAKQQTEISIA